MYTAASRPGLVVVDSFLNLVASNVEAIQILTFPNRPEKIADLDTWLAQRIRSELVDQKSPVSPSPVHPFRSAKRRYLCRPLPLNINGKAATPNYPAMVLLLERNSSGSSMSELTARFGLTPREQETVKLLLEGLTSKEIAERMNISPNTVKAFIRLVMVKMDVSTRSGIIGKMVGSTG